MDIKTHFKRAAKEIVAHMLLSKITINKAIELNINDNLLMYLSNGGKPNPDGDGSPFSVVSRRMLMINPVNIKICI